MSESPIPIAGTAPQDGDVVVTPESRSAGRHELRQHPGTVQFSVSSRDEAVRLARSFARKYAVDVWYSEKGTENLLETCRPVIARRACDRETDITSSRAREALADGPVQRR
jgi:hypothetical protein